MNWLKYYTPFKFMSKSKLTNGYKGKLKLKK